MHCDVLLVGNYVHDTLVHPHGRYETLGGSASYISRALNAMGADFRVVAKVGPDFRYRDTIPNPPIVSKTHPTTHFIDDFTGSDMAATLRAIGEPIYPQDLGDYRARIGLAVGVAMELLPETLQALHERCELVICDIQALLRVADPVTGRVSLRKLSETPFRELMGCIQVLKANEHEAAFLDIPLAGDLVITEGSEGARLLRPGRAEELRIPAYPARKLDPTGAGDSFVAGMALGLVQRPGGVEDERLAEAIRLGNRFGAFAIETIGVPDFTRLARRLSEEEAGLPAAQPEALADKALR